MKAKLTIVDGVAPASGTVAQKQEDVFTVGNLVVSEYGNRIVLVTDNPAYSSGYFAGVDLAGNHFCDNWIKDSFVQYYGSVTVSTVDSTEE